MNKSFVTMSFSVILFLTGCNRNKTSAPTHVGTVTVPTPVSANSGSVKDNPCFGEFLTKHFVREDDTLYIWNIYDTTHEYIEDSAKYACYFPPFTCDCFESIHWNGIKYMKYDDCIAALLVAECPNGGHKNVVEDYIGYVYLVTYSNVGKLIDYRLLGSEGWFNNVRIKGDIPKRLFKVMARDMLDTENYSRYKDLEYSVTRCNFEIGKNGKILDTMTKNYNEVKKYKHVEHSFEEFKESFELIKRLDTDSTVFIATKNHVDLGYEKFVPNINPTDYDVKGLDVLACRRIETDSIYVFFVCKQYSCPKGFYPYGEYVIITFDRGAQPKLIDTCTVSRRGDMYDCSIEYGGEPLTLKVRQWSFHEKGNTPQTDIKETDKKEICDYLIKIGRQGKITKRLLKRQSQ